MTNNDLTKRPSLKERVQARLSHLDLGGYKLDWLDSRRVSEIASQLQWLDDAAAEARVDGDTHSADTYDEVLEIIQIETQLTRDAARDLSLLRFAPAIEISH
ncbi:hypothetical protein [Rathayibacter rathayi]|uniref:hypothetical protein n=1 Tax=Rathayibacter rathayi TaxID=33887 RepID=UPI0011B0C68C|nr:hypothetical protein [Rathayibacter rathayi]